VIIAGTRGFSSYELLEQALDEILGDEIYGEGFESVSGGARGTDRLGERYAKRVGAEVKRFIPDWNNGKKAGILRNELMARHGTHLIAFWDGISPGTGHMIRIAKRQGLTVEVVMV